VGRRGYRPEFRREVLDLIEARPVVDLERDLGISAQLIYTWHRRPALMSSCQLGEARHVHLSPRSPRDRKRGT